MARRNGEHRDCFQAPAPKSTAASRFESLTSNSEANMVKYFLVPPKMHLRLSAHSAGNIVKSLASRRKRGITQNPIFTTEKYRTEKWINTEIVFRHLRRNQRKKKMYLLCSICTILFAAAENSQSIINFTPAENAEFRRNTLSSSDIVPTAVCVYLRSQRQK